MSLAIILIISFVSVLRVSWTRRADLQRPVEDAPRLELAAHLLVARVAAPAGAHVGPQLLRDRDRPREAVLLAGARIAVVSYLRDAAAETLLAAALVEVLTRHVAQMSE